MAGIQRYSGNEASNIDMGQLGFDVITVDGLDHYAGPAPYWVGTQDSGTHTGGDNVAVLVDEDATWKHDSLLGYTITNTSDANSKANITANTRTTITHTALSGGTDNDWDTDDAYTITHPAVMWHPDVSQWVNIMNVSAPEQSIEEILNEASLQSTTNFDQAITQDPGDVKLMLDSKYGDNITSLYLYGGASVYGNFIRITVKQSGLGGTVSEQVIAYRG